MADLTDVATMMDDLRTCGEQVQRALLNFSVQLSDMQAHCKRMQDMAKQFAEVGTEPIQLPHVLRQGPKMPQAVAPSNAA